MMMSKKYIFLVVVLFCFSFPRLCAQRDSRELPLLRQPSPNLDVHIWMDNYFRFGHQAFTAKIKNISAKKIQLSGYLVATTVCGTEVSIDYSDIILEPGQQIGVGDVNMTQTIGAIFEKDCSTPKILHPYSDRPTSIEKNAIQSIQFRSFGAAVHEDQNFSNKAGIGSNSGNSQQGNAEREKQERLDKQRKGEQDANNRRLELQRQQQLSQVDNKMRQMANSNQAILDALSSIFDYFINNMIQKSIREDNEERNKRFTELKNDISTKNGTLEDCSSCGGLGNDPCSECNSRGYKNCQSCNGNGQASCYYCKGTGTYFGRTCQFCSGKGASKCSTCSGRGKEVCASCNGLGHKQCVSCRGTGKEFRGDYKNRSNSYIGNSNEAISKKYDREREEEYNNELKELGKYKTPMHIEFKKSMLINFDNRTQAETINFLAKTIWEYSKTKYKPRSYVSNVIEEIAFADSIFYYKFHYGSQDDPTLQYIKSSKIDLNQTPVKYFEVQPGLEYDELYLNILVATYNPKEQLEFHLKAEAADNDIPLQIINAFIHLIYLCNPKL